MAGRPKIAFDAGSSDDSSEEETLQSRQTRKRSQNQSQPVTPRSRSANDTTVRSTLSTNRSRSQSQIAVPDSPQPGPSRRDTSRPASRNSPAPIVRQRPRKQPRQKVIKDIWRLQTTTKLLIPKMPFSRLVKEILLALGDFRLQSLALEALQESAEMYVCQYMEDAYRCTLHRQRITLAPSDMVLVRALRRGMEI